LVALLASALIPLPVRAQAGPAYWIAGAPLAFDRATPLDGDVAVSIHDAGFSRLLARVGATLAFAPQQRYVVITLADRRTVTFTVGDAKYLVAGVAQRATFAPFYDGPDLIVPLLATARAIGLEPVTTGGETVFEPQIGGLDVRTDGKRTLVTLRASVPIRYTTLYEAPDRVQLAFAGVGSTLAPARRVGGTIQEVDVVVTGSVKAPVATVTIQAEKGVRHAIFERTSPDTVTLAFGPPGVALEGPASASVPVAYTVPTAAATTAPPSYAPPTPPPLAATAPAYTPTPQPESAPSAPVAMPSSPSGPATVTNVAVEPSGDGVIVRIALTGSTTYEWHRLLDQRFYIDVHDAVLTGAGRDERPNLASVDSIRIRQIELPDAPGVPVVRVAITLKGDRHVDVVNDAGSLTLAVTGAPETGTVRIGSGTVGSVVAENPQATESTFPSAEATPPGPWKFGTQNGNRTIVIDPGHGGDDIGTAHNGLVEKNLTWEMALRLRALLVQDGWDVKFTRNGDYDPVSPVTLAAFQTDGLPNPSDRAYLQTRCDVANKSNARLFISIHVNYSTSTAPHGTTFYYTKPEDVALAQAMERSVIPTAGTKDDGVVKANYYVTRHTTMPAVLIETAFISNPGDVALLSSPAFLQNMAAGIEAGVRAYVGSSPTTPSKADQ
jgi:N-acetylmuramoyl-L-alanine amidase